MYGEKIRKNPQWKVKEMQETIRKELEIEFPRIKCSRVRQAALAGVIETLKDHYARVWDFGFEILKNNPGNRVDISTNRITDDSQNKFQRIYICYHALKEGWKLGCRPILGIDGCFQKTVCGGQLLSVVGRDGNNQMYPVAYAVVESESTESWRWFLGLLREDLILGNGVGLTVISDQQKGLENAMKEYLPHAEHRLCTRHLYNNMRKKWPTGLVKNYFWMAACATYPAGYQKAMKALQRHSKSAYEHLSKLDPKSWSKAFFQNKCDADNVENNMSECFNSWIVNERYMPVLTMLQELHFKIMRRIRTNREAMQHAGIVICPRIKGNLDISVKNSRKWHASWDGDKKYMVKFGTKAVTVNLEDRTCDCRAWDLTGIPCSHDVAAIHDRRHQPIMYVSKYYTKEMYMKSYNQTLQALRGEDFWEMTDKAVMLPPDIPKKLRGRPKRLRRREHWEGGSQSKSTEGVPGLQKLTSGKKMHCSLCRQAGHKKPKCPQNQQNRGEMKLKNKMKVVKVVKVAKRKENLNRDRDKRRGLGLSCQ
ncbi:uncharacterized protein LOC141679870 [Apium graveolens]|uniref:uncharacterized protein LOC141679870 n=1 Tax=Apium graveolens TaxID=4045 RepID=UPI003D796C96